MSGNYWPLIHWWWPCNSSLLPNYCQKRWPLINQTSAADGLMLKFAGDLIIVSPAKCPTALLQLKRECDGLKVACIMKQAQAMQEKMQRAQEEIAKLEVTGEAGAGMVKVTMLGNHNVRRVSIDAV